MTRDAEPFRGHNVVLGVLQVLALVARSHALNDDPPPKSHSRSMLISLSKPFVEAGKALKRSVQVREKRRHEEGDELGVSGLAAANDTGNLWVVDSLFEGQNFYE